MEIKSRRLSKYHKDYHRINNLFENKPKNIILKDIIEELPDSVICVSREKAENAMEKYFEYIKSDKNMDEIYKKIIEHSEESLSTMVEEDK